MIKNSQIGAKVLSALMSVGVKECCVCPSARNAPFVAILTKTDPFKTYYWPEERSAAFFALGRSQATRKPVAVITTSGTAVGELLPAVMEAYYKGTPLILITADRPRHYRGTGAPQSAEQVGIFGVYTPKAQDIALEENPDFSDWDFQTPLHLNVCFDEPLLDEEPVVFNEIRPIQKTTQNPKFEKVHQFLHDIEHPFVIVSELPEEAREPVVRFLCELNAPVYLEAHSGIREDPRLQKLYLSAENLFQKAKALEYPIDSLLRIGGVPTHRIWRDLEDLPNIKVFSINRVPFSGLSHRPIECVDLPLFFQKYCPQKRFLSPKTFEQEFRESTLSLFQQFPLAEPSLVHTLSKKLETKTHIYLGNSLPIREWDLAATFEQKQFCVTTSRGLNGIDGQISTFLGRCFRDRPNWAILGDLTALYDLAGPWILHQLGISDIHLMIINNGGGKIFSSMFPQREMQNLHHLNFEGFAKLWNLSYEKWTNIESIKTDQPTLIELVPNNQQTELFWKEYRSLSSIASMVS